VFAILHSIDVIARLLLPRDRTTPAHLTGHETSAEEQFWARRSKAGA
jgi:hypothetical protein